MLASAGQSISPGLAHVLGSISPEAMRANLSYLASNLLEGRDTPSPGLDIAADYIAAQFRKAGLKPVAGNSYFQTARMLRPGPPPEGFTLQFSSSGRTLKVAKDQAVLVSGRAIDFAHVAVEKAHDLADLRNADLKGKALLLDEPADGEHALAQAAAALHPAMFLETSENFGPQTARRLIDPDEERALWGDIPRLIVCDPDAAAMLSAASIGETGIVLAVHSAAPAERYVPVRNVAGLLRGSDPALRGHYLLISAHYDHIGRNDRGEINPGANDDGSGTVSVIEIARALAAMPVHPKRSILFILFFGEEEGSLGSRYYIWHPLEPLADTIADLNLEQVGRTDAIDGPQLSKATLTGFRYSSVTRTLQQAGALTGVQVAETPNDGDFFRRSDNLPFAERGIPAHTIVVALDFPGYHAPGDVWQKIDYANMAKVDRMIALAAIQLADSPGAPEWNRDDPDAAVYLHAR